MKIHPTSHLPLGPIPTQLKAGSVAHFGADIHAANTETPKPDTQTPKKYNIFVKLGIVLYATILSLVIRTLFFNEEVGSQLSTDRGKTWVETCLDKCWPTDDVPEAVKEIDEDASTHRRMKAQFMYNTLRGQETLTRKEISFAHRLQLKASIYLMTDPVGFYFWQIFGTKALAQATRHLDTTLIPRKKMEEENAKKVKELEESEKNTQSTSRKVKTPPKPKDWAERLIQKLMMKPSPPLDLDGPRLKLSWLDKWFIKHVFKTTPFGESV